MAAVDDDSSISNALMSSSSGLSVDVSSNEKDNSERSAISEALSDSANCCIDDTVIQSFEFSALTESANESVPSETN